MPATQRRTPRPNSLVLRGTVEWRDWIKRLAEFDRTNVAALLDRAAVDYAKARGFTELPPPR